jgi:hypothetical protein
MLCIVWQNETAVFPTVHKTYKKLFINIWAHHVIPM